MKTSTLKFLTSAAMFLCGAIIISLLWVALSGNGVVLLLLFLLYSLFFILGISINN